MFLTFSDCVTMSISGQKNVNINQPVEEHILSKKNADIFLEVGNQTLMEPCETVPKIGNV